MLSLPFTSKRLAFLRVVCLFPPLLRLPGFEQILNLNQSFSRGITLWSSNEPKLLPGTGDACNASPLGCNCPYESGPVTGVTWV